MQRRSSSSARIFYPRFEREEVINRIKQDLPALRKKLPVTLVVLFGSYAKGNYTIASDIDLLVVYQNPVREDAYSLSKKTIAVRGLEPHVYSEKEYDGIKETLTRMTRAGIVIFDRDSESGKK